MDKPVTTPDFEYNEEAYTLITNLQCIRNAISCLRFVHDDRTTEVENILYKITQEIEEKINAKY